MAGEVFECEIQARLRDVNLGGHVDNVEAMRIIDEARVLFLRFAELDGGDLDGAGIEGAGLLEPVPAGVVELMGSQRVDYHAEMRFTPFRPFLLRLWISHVGRSSFAVSTEMRTAADHPPALLAESTLVLWETAEATSWPIDDDVRAALERYAGPPVALRGGRA